MCRSDDKFALPEADKMDNKVSSAGVLDASVISEFVNERLGHDFGTPHVPTFFERPEVQITALVTLLGGAYTAWQLYNAPWIGHPAIWAAGCVAVFLFATSGARQAAFACTLGCHDDCAYAVAHCGLCAPVQNCCACNETCSSSKHTGLRIIVAQAHMPQP